MSTESLLESEICQYYQPDKYYFSNYIRFGNQDSSSGGAPVVSRLIQVVSGLALVAMTAIGHTQPLTAPPVNPAIAGIHAEIKADVAQVKANAKTSEITREQIQQLRTALKAKLTAIRK